MRGNPQEAGILATFTKEILNGKLHCLCSVSAVEFSKDYWKPQYIPDI